MRCPIARCTVTAVAGLVDDLAALQPDLLVTVDHGIACHAGVARRVGAAGRCSSPTTTCRAKRCPMRTPIVDPNLRGDGFPSKALAGRGRDVLRAAGVAAPAARSEGVRGAEPTCRRCWICRRSGTVADLCWLDANNRAVVGAGLRRLRAGQGCIGLRH
jgi:single-stranded-DNA-specific exonuclease